MVVNYSSLVILLTKDHVRLGYRVHSWNERHFMNQNWPWKAIHGDWLGKVSMCGIHWSSFLKILGKMKVDWKHVGSTAWIGENAEFVSENMCEMVRMSLEHTTGDAIRSRDFGKNYIKYAVPRVTDYCCWSDPWFWREQKALVFLMVSLGYTNGWEISTEIMNTVWIIVFSQGLRLA